jgi:hypothetical protein
MLRKAVLLVEPGLVSRDKGLSSGLSMSICNVSVESIRDLSLPAGRSSKRSQSACGGDYFPGRGQPTMPYALPREAHHGSLATLPRSFRSPNPPLVVAAEEKRGHPHLCLWRGASEVSVG